MPKGMIGLAGEPIWIFESCSGCWYNGGGLRKMTSRTVSVTVVAPMPAASDRTATSDDTRVAPHVARGTAEILQQVIEPEEAPGLVEALPGDGHVAEPPARSDARGVGRHPLIDEPFGLDLDVRPDFAVEVVVRTLSG